jgi:hypothetical protein
MPRRPLNQSTVKSAFFLGNFVGDYMPTKKEKKEPTMFKNRDKVIETLKNLPPESGIPALNGIQSAANIFQILGSIYDQIGETEKSRICFIEAIDGFDMIVELLMIPLRELEDGPPLIVTAAPMQPGNIPRQPFGQNRRRK